MRHDLESLIGTLQHTYRVVRPGRSFLRRMINILRVLRRPHHHVRLNKSFQEDLQWWLSFASQWNGVAILLPERPITHEVTSDASCNWGCSAWSQSGWFQFQWPEDAIPHHITFKELFAVVLACSVWGRLW